MKTILQFIGAIQLGLVVVVSASAQTASNPPAAPASPPSAPAQRSAADLEKLVAPIALYPDPLIATLLPASVYPLEIVQAARFVKDTNNIAKLDAQPWDSNVKALARFPDVITKMNDEIAWTSDLGQAFLDQQADVMAAIQTMRGKANSAGTLKTTPQQNVVVTNTVVEKTVEQQIVYVTNTVVQIQPAQPEVIYVPQYNPTVVYAAPPPTSGEVIAAGVISFGIGMAVGAAFDNDCDWHGGGIYVGGGWGHGDVDVDIDRNVNVNQTVNRNVNQNVNQNVNRNTSGQKWQPDPNRVRNSGAPGSSQSLESRGWSGSGGSGAAQGATPTTAQNRATPPAGATRPPASPNANRPDPSASRPTPSPDANRPAQNASRPTPSPNASRPAPTASQPTPSPSASRPTPSASPPTTPSASRPTPSPAASAPKTASSSGGGSAFGGVNNGARDHAASSRGAASRGGGGGGRRG